MQRRSRHAWRAQAWGILPLVNQGDAAYSSRELIDRAISPGRHKPKIIIRLSVTGIVFGVSGTNPKSSIGFVATGVRAGACFPFFCFVAAIFWEMDHLNVLVFLFCVSPPPH
jgi:hypothetical protein